MLLGNAVVPAALRAAFLTLVSGFTVAPRDTVNKADTTVRFETPVDVTPLQNGDKFPDWGYANASGVHSVPKVSDLPKPVFDLVLSPDSFEGTRKQEARGERSPTLSEPVPMSYWSTPRSVMCAGRILTKRMSHDLPTQVRFERGTPDHLRSGQISANFVEWVMGYPADWTRMSEDHVTVMPVGYRPSQKKRPDHETSS